MNCVFKKVESFSVCEVCGFKTKSTAPSIIKRCSGFKEESVSFAMESTTSLTSIDQSILPGKVLVRCVKCGGLESATNIDMLQDIHHTCMKPDRDVVPLKMPSHAVLAFNAAKAAIKHVASGMKQCDEQKILERFLVCSSCDMYNDVLGKCSSCGCYVNAMKYGDGPNKLAIASESCPIGKWQKETD